MDNSKMMRYSSEGVTVVREVVAQRSCGDGEENTLLVNTSDAMECFELNKKHNDKCSQIINTSKSQLIKHTTGTRDIGSSQINVHKSSIPRKSKLASTYPKLPQVEVLAQKLSKVSLFSLPDCQLLNSHPKDLESQHMVQLKASPVKSKYGKSHKITNSFVTRKRKEPRFVPYEPYKACTRPIVPIPRKKSSKKVKSESTNDNNKVVTLNTMDSKNDPTENYNELQNRLQVMVYEFEMERTKWEEDRITLDGEHSSLKEKLIKANKHNSTLEQQLAIQSQVNKELKKLLVASVGEDVQGRVQCLTEDKARMSTMIRHYSEKVDRDYEEREKMSIQCDVWHSKFLGCSLLVDELARWKALLRRHLEDSRDALTLILDERSITQQRILHTYRLLTQIRDAFDPLCVDGGGGSLLGSVDTVTTSISTSDLAESVRDRLLGNLGRAVGCSNIKHDELETHTPGEKLAKQVLEESVGYSDCHCDIPSAASRSSMVQRFHPHTRFDHVTVNCCSKCNGEIQVI